MAADAIEEWRRELAEGRSGSSQPPPSPRPVLPRARRAAAGDSLLGVPAALGGLLALAVLVIHGWPPRLAPVSPAFALIPAVPAAVALAVTRSKWLVPLWALAASVAGFVVVFTVVPAWGVVKVLDCWFSWLTDC